MMNQLYNYTQYSLTLNYAGSPHTGMEFCIQPLLQNCPHATIKFLNGQLNLNPYSVSSLEAIILFL